MQIIGIDFQPVMVVQTKDGRRLMIPIPQEVAEVLSSNMGVSAGGRAPSISQGLRGFNDDASVQLEEMFRGGPAPQPEPLSEIPAGLRARLGDIGGGEDVEVDPGEELSFEDDDEDSQLR